MNRGIAFQRIWWKGVTLIELLLGVTLFSLLLTLVCSGLQVSQRSLEVSRRQIPPEVILQNAVDSASRYIRQSVDVAGGGTNLSLKQWDGNWKNLSFDGQTLLWDGVPLQGNLSGVRFSVEPGSVAKYVTLWASTSVQDSENHASSKVLESSVSLRDVARATPAKEVKSTPAPPPPDTPSGIRFSHLRIVYRLVFTLHNPGDEDYVPDYCIALMTNLKTGDQRWVRLRGAAHGCVF